MNYMWQIMSLVLVPLVVGCAGCGTNFGDLAYQAGGAATRTAADLLLTDFYNAVADAWDGEQESLDQDNAGDGDTDGDGSSDGDGDGGLFEGLAGDAIAGLGLYIDAGCDSCHCDDGSGGCALSAPPANGVTADVLDDVLRGDAVHPTSSPELTDQDIANLQAFLSSNDGGAAEPPSGNVDNGMTIFVANGCGGCHCDDASGGCASSAPSIAGVALDTLDDIIRGDDSHPFTKLDLSDEELNDVHAYLAGL